MKKTFNENNQLLKDRNKMITYENEEYELKLTRGRDLDSLVIQYTNFEKLTFGLVNDFISLIEIGETQKDETQKDETQEIVIHWNI